MTTKKEKNKLFSMFITFLKIGLFTFGGGYAMIPLMEKEIVDNNKWLEKEKFTETVSLTQTIPGSVSVNLSILLGYNIEGIIGSIVSAIGVILPSFVIILLIALALTNLGELALLEKAFNGIRPAVAAFILYAAFSLSKSIKWSTVLFLVFLISFLLTTIFSVNPIYIIAGAFIIGSLSNRIKNKDK
ncbi:MAG: chromate transporter [Defluviitoga tunisiensis]|jgi:chromate transporter|uniref:Chromate transporter n=1 Tax=Defluviitoga tunisiensis TaxID=1006576 RepID=A0A0C7P0J1_DEFTU|nr:chromate transporter [Defluviitoga tunisiensis]MDD3601209.1 chromate transporter [Defluviitoga tunisiensis]MDY0379926.1 chromate transporter [Defluviitoga tunisiensis]CEP77554.1 chromate transporter [Defluviitoga tunisiensis]HHV01428.1 chromate transporter [Defluviitoga tunisiensis]HOB55768.1 chromate transporter [Defluviitoga tunisiensis]